MAFKLHKYSLPPVALVAQSLLLLLLLVLALVTPSLGLLAARNSTISNNTMETPAVVGPLYKFTSQLMVTLNGGGGGGNKTADSGKHSENLIVSPISIHKALNLVLLGADSNSTTKRELLQALGYGATRHDAEVLKFHEDYARVLANFAELTRKGLAAMSEERAEDESEEDFKRRQRYGSFGPQPPVIDMFNMVITHNQAQVRPEYAALARRLYESSVKNADDAEPATKQKIMDQLNEWGKGAGFEQPIMKEEELGGDWEAILLSAVRVQAAWFKKFYEREASEGIFFNHGLRESPVHGKRLHLDELEHARYLELTADEARAQHKRLHARASASAAFKALSSLNVQIVQVPLEGELSYTIFEPLEHSTAEDNKLATLVRELFAGEEPKITRLLELLDESNEAYHWKLELAMPKFKFERELQLVEALKSMGLARVFDRRQAEVAGITEKRLYVSEVKHQAMIDVNDKGLKAAGVTKVQMVMVASLSTPREPLKVAVTKPFVFLIRYQKIPLFVGQLTSL